MRNKQMQKWIMYHEVHKQHREGLKSAQIARELGMDRRTVKKYLAMSEEEIHFDVLAMGGPHRGALHWAFGS